MEPQYDTAAAAAAEQELFVDCLDLDDAGREARLATADPAIAARVRRLLGLHREADAGRQSLPALDLAEVPELGRYQALQQLGEGGMGEVWLASQVEPLRRLVAVKLLKPGLLSRELAGRFAAERHALSLMNHPGIASILDGGEAADGRPFIVMEYVAGLPITRFCAEHALDLDQRVRLVAAAAGAVQHAHQRGVIHRDLKPSNILVSELDGTPSVKVIDFGIAKLLEQPLGDPGVHTRVGLLMGTPDYMSPEQASGSPFDIDTRSDVWSLGAVLHELLTGVPPFTFSREGASIGTIHERLTREDLPRPSRRVLMRDDAAAGGTASGLPPTRVLSRKLADELDWIVLKAMERDRNRRYESAGAFAADLERYLAGATVEAHPPGAAYRTRKFISRHPAVTTGLAAVVLSATAWAVLVAGHARELAVERDRANREAEIARRVTEFTTEIFSLASPDMGHERLVTARELIDVAARRLAQGDVSGSAEVQAALNAAAAEAYRGLGAVGEAERLFERTLELRRAALPAGDPDIGRTLDALGLLARNRGDYALARQRHVEAEAVLARSLGPLHDDTVTAGLGVVETDRLRGEPAAATSRLEAITAGLEKAGRTQTLGYASALVVTGRMAVARGDFAAAEAALSQALAIRNQLLGGLSLSVIATETDLAGVYLLTGQFAAADERLQSVLERSRRLYGPRHPEVAATLNNIGMNLLSLGRAQEAEATLREAYDQFLEFRGPDTPDTVTVLNNIALAAQAAGRYPEAESAFRQVLDFRVRNFGNRHEEVAVTRVNLAALLNLLGRHDEARRELELAVRDFSDTLGAGHWRVGNAQRHLGEALAGLGRTVEARTVLQQSVANLTASLGPDHPRTQAAVSALATLGS